MADSRFPYFVLGLGIGTAMGLLFAPRPGEQTRDELRLRAAEGRDYLKKRGSEVRGQAEEILDRGRSAVQGQRDQLAAALEAGRKAYREATGADPSSKAAGRV